jgi:hypothetical protein
LTVEAGVDRGAWQEGRTGEGLGAYYSGRWAELHAGDCAEVLPGLPEGLAEAVIADPPYGLSAEPKPEEVLARWLAGEDYEHGKGGFMNKRWDSFVPGPKTWREVYRSLKPGGFLLCFAGARTRDYMGISLRLAGFRVEDSIEWVYGCLSEDTEILVEGEWRSFRTIQEGERALCFDRERNTFGWEPILEVLVYPYRDTAFRIRSDSTDQLVSRNHRLLVERDGELVFALAEQAAPERQVRVPVLEGVQRLLEALPVPDHRPGQEERDVLSPLRPACPAADDALGPAQAHNPTDANRLRGVRREDYAPQGPPGKESDLLLQVQRALAGTGVFPARAQGTCSVDARVPEGLVEDDARGEEPGVEGRRHAARKARAPQALQVRPVPLRVRCDGDATRGRGGAQARGREGARPPAAARGGRPSRGRELAEQRPAEPDVVRLVSRTHAVRASRFARTDLASITPVPYEGIVWCVRVPSGAFVARRNGQVFVTGNSGYPARNRDAASAVEAAAGPEAAETFRGRGTALKPAHETVLVAKRPLSEPNLARNLLRHGTGTMNVDACRIEGASGDGVWGSSNRNARPERSFNGSPGRADYRSKRHPKGRFPANVVLSCCGEAGAPCPDCPVEELDRQSGRLKSGANPERRRSDKHRSVYGAFAGERESEPARGESVGGASRFFYCAKASASERELGLAGFEERHRTLKLRDDLTREEYEYVVRELKRAGVSL